MPNSAPRRESTQSSVAKNSTRTWQVLTKRRWPFITAGIVLAVWIVFLVAMAAYN